MNADSVVTPVTSVAYDGDPAETIAIKCVECGTCIECARNSIYLGLLAREGWKIERGPNGQIVATCGGCRETDPGDGPGERDV